MWSDVDVEPVKMFVVETFMKCIVKYGSEGMMMGGMFNGGERVVGRERESE
jgi:hypothetical protein